MNTMDTFTLAEPTSAQTEADQRQQQSLRQCVEHALEVYFDDLDGQSTNDLYQLVLKEVEAPLLEAVMNYTRNNQSKTAEMLGLNRGTLRKKLKQYDLL